MVSAHLPFSLNNWKEAFRKDFFKTAKSPSVCNRIGVVTSRSGAVIQDIITAVKQTLSWCEIILYPTKVQGEAKQERLPPTLP